jgi:uncharacterized protein YecA (UPF0149 family)
VKVDPPSGIEESQPSIGGTMEILRRNALCPCGSLKKYKRCHGLEIPKSLFKPREEFVPSVYRPFPPHGISPSLVEAMRVASRQQSSVRASRGNSD